MANIFNAITTGAGGLATTSDSSGTFSFQKDGVAKATLDGSGTFTATSFVGSGANLTNIPTAGGSSSQTASFTLTSSSNAYQSVNVNSGSVTCTLPDATTMNLGRGLFYIYNAGSVSIKVNDNGGNCLGFISPTKTGIVNLSDKSTAAGTWNITNATLAGVEICSSQTGFAANTTGSGGSFSSFKVSATQDLLVWSWAGTNPRTYAAVYDSSVGTLGTAALIKSANISVYNAIAVSSTSILLVTCAGTAMEAVVLSLSGTTITVNTAATATLGSNITYFQQPFISTGGGYVMSYVRTTLSCLRAFTVSGTTVTIGTETALATTDSNQLYYVSSGVVLWATYNTAGTSITWTPYTVSGTTLTAGTGTSVTKQGTAYPDLFTFNTGGRWGSCYASSSSQYTGAVISVSGTTATSTTVALESKTTYPQFCFGTVVGNQYIYAVRPALSSSTVISFNVLTDNAGTATAGTAVTVSEFINTAVSPGQTSSLTTISANQTTKEVVFYYNYQNVNTTYIMPVGIIRVGVSGNNPVINYTATHNEGQGSIIRSISQSNYVYNGSNQSIALPVVNGLSKGICYDFGGAVVNNSSTYVMGNYYGSNTALVNGVLTFVDIPAFSMPATTYGTNYGLATSIIDITNITQSGSIGSHGATPYDSYWIMSPVGNANNASAYYSFTKLKWTTL